MKYSYTKIVLLHGKLRAVGRLDFMRSKRPLLAVFGRSPDRPVWFDFCRSRLAKIYPMRSLRLWPVIVNFTPRCLGRYFDMRMLVEIKAIRL